MSTKSKRRAARRHPDEVKPENEDVIAATIVEGLLTAVTFGAIEEPPKSSRREGAR